MKNIEMIQGVETPAFVYCLDTLARSKNEIQDVLNEVGVGNWIAYSYKTNPLLATALAEMGCTMQVTSLKHLAEVQGFLTKEALTNSFYCSGSMTVDDAKVVVDSGPYIVVDSVSQLACVEKAAGLVGKNARVLIRVDAGQSADNSPFGTSGMLQGVNIRQLPEVLSKLYGNLTIVGVHNHFGSQVTSLEAWRRNIECIAAVLRNIDYPFEILNLGGGSPIAYDSVNAPSIGRIYSESIFQSLSAIRDIHPNIKIVVEPGRYIAGPCGYLVATATNMHQADAKRGVNLDASLFAAFQDRFLSNLKFQLPVISPCRSDIEGIDTILRGSSPASIDYFGVYSGLDEIALGEKVVFGMAGAYASSMGSEFSGVSRPAEYLFNGAEMEVLKSGQ
ncbi:diaminopimelate decarboxylase family protein [Pseudomonas aeruginosa]|uniref:diaminopimelate decarboxylase family protein n=1 Tax=Pseudomonas aeruginosa TaxID=287 RepID=UPI0009A8E344|nr:alanine racemase [Pseudomonas aeruginosa]QTQ99635.1 alanine racemase [Pseudomonas aeruginosa]HCD7566964.1 alanine racemase [Pseudomonas aeruginosa]HCD7570246.1 alanine racemase [Pseudomonas aeruginosa]HCZ9130750.1 alanine racemase [Pseudomonas aeruginosa]